MGARWGAWAPRAARSRCWWLLPAAAVLFACYLRLSWTVPATSDGAATALQAWDMLHGNVLLRGWTISDVSFYTTELPEYAGVEAVHGLGPGVVHIAAALTYTLAVLLAGLLAKGRATGREGLARALVASGILLAPQLGHGAFVLLLSPDHTGTSVPVLIAWLVLDRAPRRWYVPVVIGVLLTWVQVADRVALVTAALPLAGVCAARACLALARRRRPSAYELSLAAAAAASAAAAWLAGRVIAAAGGFTAHPLGAVPAPPGSIPVHLWLTAQGIAALYGASLPGHGPLWPALPFAAAHLAGLALAGCALGLALWRFPRGRDLIVPVLAAAIVANVATYAFSTLPGTAVGTGYATREIAAVLPFGAVLAGRLLPGPLLARLSAPGTVSRPARARLTAHGLAALGLAACAAVYLAALGYGAAQPAVPAQEQDLAGWLAAHDLTGGLGAAEANVTTLDSGGNIRVVIATFSGGGAAADAYQSEASWYDPALHYANFVITSAPQGTSVSFPGAAVLSAFGRPARIDHFRAYTIMVWDRNLLADLRQRTRDGV